MNRHPTTDYKNRSEPQVELESQFILRLPPEPARVLRETLRNGLSLKDRLSIKLENDMRYGEVRFDHWLLHGKIVDLPTIVESLKTIDNKSFYKTADICQMLICKEEDDHTTTDEESPVRQKKRSQ
uniref:Transcription initiation factor TFIID subunit 7 n=1 Tax=Apis cerana TaxID=7461 RepID=V9ILN3_APICE